VDLARELTSARYAALAVTDRHDRTQGFFVAGLDPSILLALKGPPQGHGPLGSLREDGHPVRYENVEQARKAFGFPPDTTQKLMGIALVGGDVRGSICVTDREDGGQFDDDDDARCSSRPACLKRDRAALVLTHRRAQCSKRVPDVMPLNCMGRAGAPFERLGVASWCDSDREFYAGRGRSGAASALPADLEPESSDNVFMNNGSAVRRAIARGSRCCDVVTPVRHWPRPRDAVARSHASRPHRHDVRPR
jgi:hypothetical protein